MNVMLLVQQNSSRRFSYMAYDHSNRVLGPVVVGTHFGENLKAIIDYSQNFYVTTAPMGMS